MPFVSTVYETLFKFSDKMAKKVLVSENDSNDQVIKLEYV